MPRTLLVSNRLPITVRAVGEGALVKRSSGGLVSALQHVHQQHDSLWFGWPGDISQLGVTERAELREELAKDRLAPIELTREDVRGYYDGFANGVLWPLCHYLLDKVRTGASSDWVSYCEVNARFADAVAREMREGDVVWVHDYHLALVPTLIRAQRPHAKIGYFLHIPFPAPEAFRILPWREHVLRGLLGSDVIGFHTFSYAHHFTHAVSQLLGTEPGLDVIRFEDREVRVGAFPIGIDVSALENLTQSAEARKHKAEIREAAQGKRVVLGIDRLDYTKGIPSRLMTIERLLEHDPEQRGQIQYVQIAVPTREGTDEYADFRRHVNELIGRINGAHGTPSWTPIHVVHRSVGPEELVGLYSAADVMLVTPLRDGMNLVAKEYVACRLDDTGVLVLSEFAGASAELHEALQVNPYDIEGTQTALLRALAMPVEEQKIRMRAMRRTVSEHDVAHWCRAFLEALGDTSFAPPSREPATDVEPAIQALRRADSMVILLDCDGTILPFATVPHLVTVDASLLDLLQRLTARAGARVHVVSGRSRESLERWFGHMQLGLHAEHGLWSRAPGQPSWTPMHTPPLDWKDPVMRLMTDVARRTSGSIVEEKSAMLAWHFRAVDRNLATARANELLARLHTITRESDVLEVLHGARVIEVRPRGIHKGLIVGPVLSDAPSHAAVLAMGDDRTDEDLFAALPERAISVHVGPGRTIASHRLTDTVAVRRFLSALVGER